MAVVSRGPWWVAALALLCAPTLLCCLLAPPALAQDPSLRMRPQLRANRSFPKQPGGILGPSPKIDRAQPLYMQADQLIYDTKNNRVIAQGNVEIYFNNYILTADKVIYDQGINKLFAEGNAQLKDPNGSITRADKFEALDDFRDAFVQSLSMVTSDDTRIAAERASRREGNVTEFESGRFTPCKNEPGMPPLWCLSAARIVHDQQAGTIMYQDAWFELFGVPVLYAPYFQHPDPSVKRQSGFLAPSQGHSTTLGYSVEVPYYFALAPNYDFTFHPRYFSEQGVLWQGDWRHRLANGQYSINFAAIDQSSIDSGASRAFGDTELAGLAANQGTVLAVILVALRLGRHDRERRDLPPLLPARSHPADRPCQRRLSAGDERPQLLRRQPLPLRRSAADRHRAGQLGGAPGHRLQLHLGHACRRR